VHLRSVLLLYVLFYTRLAALSELLQLLSEPALLVFQDQFWPVSVFSIFI
jgi:hypothetical protein